MVSGQSGFFLDFTVFGDSGATAQVFLHGRLVAAHAEQLNDFFRLGYIFCNNRAISASYICKENDCIRLFLPDHVEEEVDTGWRMLWQNDSLLAVYKPHLLPVSRTTRNLYNTLISLVRRQTPYSDARLLHRLDTETAGIILLAKNASSDQFWKPRFNELVTEKIYHARVQGVPDWRSFYCSCELAEKQGSLIRSQMYVVEPDISDTYIKPKRSRTLFRVVSHTEQEALVECQLITGRKHQIRAQLAWLGHPVIGDKIYSNRGSYYLKRIESGLDETDIDELGSPFQCLTAVSVALSIDGERIRLSLP